MTDPTETTWQHSWMSSSWVIIVAGIVFVLILMWIYRLEPGTDRRMTRVLAASIRVILGVLLVWMIFGWSTQQHRTEPADLIIAADDSASMAFEDDQWDQSTLSQVRRRLPVTAIDKPSRFELVQSLLEHPRYGWLKWFATKYNVKVVTLADRVRATDEKSANALQKVSPDRPASRLGTGLRDLIEAQRGRPTAAIVMLTDGATTEGPTIADMSDLARERGVPLYIVGIGSERPVRDLRLSSLLADDVAFVDDLVTISCQLHASGLAGHSTTIRVRNEASKEVLAEQVVSIPPGDNLVPVRLSFRATSVGEHRLRLEADPLPGEPDRENNSLSHTLTVHDATIRVLLVYSYPSYEYRYLKDFLGRLSTSNAADSHKAFSLTTILQEADREQVENEASTTAVFPVQLEELLQYDVVILGDVDPLFIGSAASAHVVEFVRKHGGGVIFIAGPRYMPMAFRGTNIEPIIPFDLSRSAPPAADSLSTPQPVQLTPVGQAMPPFQLLPKSVENATLWQSLPGLLWRWNVTQPSEAARVLVEQSAPPGAMGNRLPIVMMQYFGAGRVMFQTTDESYRWARYDETDEYYSRYWVQTIRYLGRSKLLRGRSPAEITVERQQYIQGEEVGVRVRFLAEGRAGEFSDGVVVMIEPRQGSKQELRLLRNKNSPEVFSGTVSNLMAGEYRVWLVSPSLEKPPDARTFTVAGASREQAIGPMNAADLQLAAKISEGRFYTLANVDRLPYELPRGQQVRVESLPQKPVWNSPWVAAAFVILITAEWILRKRAGML